MDKMNILAIGAHPDDIEIGCAGTLVKYADKGHNVFLLVMTGGEEGGEGGIRKKEQEDSNKIIGVKHIFWGGHKDTHIAVDKKTISDIEEILAKVEPSFIFCPFPDDTHQDHRHLCQATQSATRNLRNVLFYETPTTCNFTPHVFVNISDTLDRKIKSLEAHASQVTKTNIEDLSIVEIAKSSANFRGIQGRVKYAEAFHALRLFINI